MLRSSGDDKVLVIGAAITLREAMTAAEKLEGEGINVRVMDLFTIKPIDKDAIITNAKECGGRIIVVEDHYPEGQLVPHAYLHNLANEGIHSIIKVIWKVTMFLSCIISKCMIHHIMQDYFIMLFCPIAYAEVGIRHFIARTCVHEVYK